MPIRSWLKEATITFMDYMYLIMGIMPLEVKQLTYGTNWVKMGINLNYFLIILIFIFKSGQLGNNNQVN